MMVSVNSWEGVELARESLHQMLSIFSSSNMPPLSPWTCAAIELEQVQESNWQARGLEKVKINYVTSPKPPDLPPLCSAAHFDLVAYYGSEMDRIGL